MTIEELFTEIDKINKQHFDLTNSTKYLQTTWWEINDIPVAVLREYANKTERTMTYEDAFKSMAVQARTGYIYCTIFLRSVKVQLQQHIVEDSAFVNI